MKKSILLFLSHVRGYCEAWRARHDDSYDHEQLVQDLVEKHEKDLYDPNKQYIYRSWTSTYVSALARQKKRLGNGRQLIFEGEDFEALSIAYKVPACLKLPERLGGVGVGSAKREDWVEYLKGLASHVEFAIGQSSLMSHLFEHILDPIFQEHPGIDTNAGIEIAIERGLLKELRQAEEDGESEAQGNGA